MAPRFVHDELVRYGWEVLVADAIGSRAALLILSHRHGQSIRVLLDQSDGVVLA